MELPANLFGSVAEEGDIYFFTSDCPVGIADHMHVCVKHADKIILLSTCSSKIDTAMRTALDTNITDVMNARVIAVDDYILRRMVQVIIHLFPVVELREQ